MKWKISILTQLILICISGQLNAQDMRQVIATSTCNGSGFKSALSDYYLGYSYRGIDSTLIISGYLGYENCGIEHIFTAQIDSNKVVLSEIIIDTMLATCSCTKRVKIEIDSFCYDKFTVEFDGKLLTDLPSEEQNNTIRIYPNPTSGVLTVELSDLPLPMEVTLIDSYGRILQTEKTREQNSVEFDLSHCISGLYMIRIGDLNFARLLIKN